MDISPSHMNGQYVVEDFDDIVVLSRLLSENYAQNWQSVDNFQGCRIHSDVAEAQILYPNY